MATKGASNRYIHTQHGRKNTDSQNINYAWAKDFNKRTLKKHFEDHGLSMGCSTQEEYAAKAVHFANTIDKKNCVSFVDKNGSTYKYNVKTNTLAIITSDGYVVTYYHPKDGYDYYLRQKEDKQ